VCCSVLQCVAVCCSVLQCVAVCCSVLQSVAVCCSVLQCVAVCCSVSLVSSDISSLVSPHRSCLLSPDRSCDILWYIVSGSSFHRGWQRPIGCLKWQVILCKRATYYRALLREMTSNEKAPYDSTPLDRSSMVSFDVRSFLQNIVCFMGLFCKR